MLNNDESEINQIDMDGKWLRTDIFVLETFWKLSALDEIKKNRIF